MLTVLISGLSVPLSSNHCLVQQKAVQWHRKKNLQTLTRN